MLFGFGLYMFLFLFCWFYFKPSSVKNHSRFAVAHCFSSDSTLHTGGFIAGMGSKTRSVEIFRVYNRSGNSQTVELSLITFVRDVTNPSSLLASFQQVEEMSVDGICVSLERQLGVNALFFLVKILTLCSFW